MLQGTKWHNECVNDRTSYGDNKCFRKSIDYIQCNNGHGGQYDQVLDKREPGNNNNGYKKGITSFTTTSIIDGTNTETTNGTRETTTQESNPTY